MSSGVPTPMSVDSLKAAILAKVQATHVEVEDKSGGCGAAFEVVIVSPLFEGKPLLQRHRLVNDLLKQEIGAMHAFSQKTYTPEQWAKMQATK
ncbi:bola protein [Catenaria anguillulae PL171]|uniref:Bola protein n=1 Tax=Catenaria anguillulae PL171 TaxID=765915 RepID=A0A1Y2HX85_9FUNG|nr:bola protein [Catenaria anguillulae PL171]